MVQSLLCFSDDCHPDWILHDYLDFYYYLDVLLGDYEGHRVAVKVLKRSEMVQSLLDEAKFMM